jgi:hypothetical protein
MSDIIQKAAAEREASRENSFVKGRRTARKERPVKPAQKVFTATLKESNHEVS